MKKPILLAGALLLVSMALVPVSPVWDRIALKQEEQTDRFNTPEGNYPIRGSISKSRWTGLRQGKSVWLYTETGLLHAEYEYRDHKMTRSTHWNHDGTLQYQTRYATAGDASTKEVKLSAPWWWDKSDQERATAPMLKGRLTSVPVPNS